MPRRARARRCRCSARAASPACCCSWPANSTSSRRNSPRSSSGWRKTCRLRSTSSTRPTRRSAPKHRVHFLANHDSLTGLPNRDHFNRLLEQKIKACAETQRKCAVLFIDLDRFKVINDFLGHAAGDRLLVEIANRLRACTRTNDIVARLGGDEFVVLLGDVQDRDGNHCRGQAHSCRDRAGDDACGLRVPRHRQHRRRALSRQRHRRRDADQERRYGDVRRQGRRQERRAVLLVRGKIAVGRTARRWKATCAMRSNSASSRLRTSRSSMPPRVASPAWRRCCAGRTRSSARCRR